MKESRMAVRMIALLSLQHMLVDFLCAYGLYHDTSLPFAGYVIYNFLAFVLQLRLLQLALLTRRPAEGSCLLRDVTPLRGPWWIL